MTDNDDTTQDFPVEQFAPSSQRWSHSEALHFASIAVQPEIYDPKHAALAKLAEAYLELSRQHTKLADRIEEMRAAPEDIERLTAAISHRGFCDVWPQTAAAIKRLLERQAG